MTADIFEAGEHNTELSAEELNEVERLNINAARIWAMRPGSLRNPELLTDGFARELHKRMFNQVWRWAGRYRATERNLGWEPFRLSEGMRNAFNDARAWLEFSTYSLHEAAVRLHHRLVVIHPWPNGNGRHARLMADVLVASRGGEALTWGARADLVPISEVRARYIAAVQQADQGEIAPLLAFACS
jgi:Fic-DOC domain mobile mystery protein B